MIISNCPACVNGAGCCSPHTNSVECERVEDCVIKQIVIHCEINEVNSGGVINTETILDYLT